MERLTFAIEGKLRDFERNVGFIHGRPEKPNGGNYIHF